MRRVRAAGWVGSVAAAGVLVAAQAVFAGGGAQAAGSSRSSSVDKVAVFTPALKLFGTVTLSRLGGGGGATRSARAAGAAVPAPHKKWRIVDNKVVAYHPAAELPSSKPTAALRALTSTEVAGEHGFVGLTGPEQAAANGGIDLEPPDQGLCAGGGYVVEFINNALAVYRPGGARLSNVIPTYQLFKKPVKDAFDFSDPRCYYDAPSKRWFLDEFTIASVSSKGKATTPSTQYIEVSDTSNPLGSYHVWGFDTTDSGAPHCPCFGDYDQLGADDNGIYITTDEFPLTTGGYNGVVMYAVSKQLLEYYQQSRITPVVFGYRITSDAFGQPIFLAPTTTPQGAVFARNTEYFVESDLNKGSDDHLEVYALHNTSQLGTPAPPKLYVDETTSEGYAFPPDARQKPGPRPLGVQVQSGPGGIQADFDAVMETTFLHGIVYGEIDTATSNTGDSVAWFQLRPSLSGSTLAVHVVRQGYVAVKGTGLLYPYTALSSDGHGYLVFSLSGPHNYPSAAYVSYGPAGPSGPVRIAAGGVAPDDGFTCYAAFTGPSYGGCRWGDYSMGAASGDTVYLAAEMIPRIARDTLTNWGTFVWSAPAG